MAEISHLQNEQERAEQRHAADIRFKQQIFQTVGGAMLFALTGVVTSKLLGLGAMAGGGGMLLPVLGIAAVGAIGLTCVYCAAKYLSKVVSLDQERQAQKIHEAARGKEQEVDLVPQLETGKTTSLPLSLAAQDLADMPPEKAADAPRANMPTPRISQAVYQQKLVGQPQLARA